MRSGFLFSPVTCHTDTHNCTRMVKMTIRMVRRDLLTAGLACLLPATARAEVLAKVVIGRDGWLFPAWEDIRHTNLARRRNQTQLLGQAAQIMRQAGIATTFALTPQKARIGADFLPDDFRPDAAFGDAYALAAADLRQSGAIVPDLAAVLLAGQKATGDVFFKADTHWTANGAELAAIEVARVIKPLLPAKKGKGGVSLGGLQTHSHTGDLVTLLPDSEQSKFKPQPFKLHAASVARSGGDNQGGLIDDSAADLVVIGNSYTQPYFGFPLVLSNQLALPVDLSWKTARFGPYRTMLDYLASPMFRSARPAMVVWHVMEGVLEWGPDNNSAWSEAAMAPQAFLDGLRKAVARG
jgi:alginate O-acetyltransferase complex protein AlgJ